MRSLFFFFKGTIQLTFATFVTMLSCKKRKEKKKKFHLQDCKSDVRVEEGLAPRLWLLWVIVVHASLDIHKINKYKNNGRNIPFANTELSRSMELSGPLTYLKCLRKVRVVHTRSVEWRYCHVSVFTSIVRFKPDAFVSEYRPSAYGRVVVMLNQRLQLRRRVRGWVPGVVCQKRRGRSRDGRTAALR